MLALAAPHPEEDQWDSASDVSDAWDETSHVVNVDHQQMTLKSLPALKAK